MFRKQKQEEPEKTATENVETAEEIKQVKLRVRREHIETPHFVELRWNDRQLIEARMQDARFTSTIGAKPVEQILSECGAKAPVNNDVLEITFSPNNGEIVCVLPVRETAETSETGE